MGPPLGESRGQGQDGLGAVEGLDLTLFIDTQHQGLVGRIQIQPDDVAHLVDELGVGGELEGLDPVRLQAEGVPQASWEWPAYTTAAPEGRVDTSGP